MNIVEAGADNTGNEPIDDVFHDEAQDDTLIEFPEGTYKVNQLHLYQLSHFAMVGENATLVPGEDHSEELWIAGSEVEDLRFESFTLDTTEEGVSPEVAINALDGLVVRDIHKKGYQSDGGTAFALGATTEGGSGLVENLVATDGGKSVGIYCECKGAMTIRNCHLENFEDNGLYASAGDGPVTVEGGTYLNNNVAQIRLGSPESSVTGTTVGADRNVTSDGAPANMRGIRVADGPGPVRIENCDVRMEGGKGTGGIVGAYSGGSFEVRNTRIFVAKEYGTVGSGGGDTSYGIYVDSIGGDNQQPGTRSLHGVSITGGGNDHTAMLFRRNDNEVTDVCINQSGGDRNGITFENSRGNEVTNSTIDVPGKAIVMRGDSGATLANNSKQGSCPQPGSSDTTDGSEAGTSGDGNEDGTSEESTDEESTHEHSTHEHSDGEQTSGDGSSTSGGDSATQSTSSRSDQTSSSASTSSGSSSSSSSSSDSSSASGDGDGCPKT